LEKSFEAPGFYPLLSMLLLVLLLNSLSYVAQSTFRRKLDYRWLAVRGLAATAISSTLGIGMAISGYGIWSLVAQSWVFAIISTVLIWLKVPYNPFAKPDFKGAYPVLAYGGYLFLGKILNFICNRAIELVLAQRYGMVALAAYVIGTRIQAVLAQLVTRVLLDVSFSSFSRLRDDAALLAAQAVKILRLSSVLSVPVFMGLAALSSDICIIAFGPEKGISAAPYLTISGLFGALMVIHFLTGSILSALSLARLVTTFLAIQSVVSLIIYLPDWGLSPFELVFWTYCAVFSVFPFQLIAFKRATGLSAANIISSLLPSFAAGTIMFGVVRIAQSAVIANHPEAPIAHAAWIIPSGVIVYLLSLYALSPADGRMALKAIARRLSAKRGATS
jgi:O-antigen/teichoic acid export membrane protein